MQAIQVIFHDTCTKHFKFQIQTKEKHIVLYEKADAINKTDGLN